MSESKLNLVASTLTNSLGTTIIGHVASENVVITVKYANNDVDTTTSDKSRSEERRVGKECRSRW